jgi:hypothetical protein
MAAPRPYRDFLTPALHKRFTNAALLTLGLCYIEATWFGRWDSECRSSTLRKWLMNSSILAMVSLWSHRFPHTITVHIRPQHFHPSHSTTTYRRANDNITAEHFPPIHPQHASADTQYYYMVLRVSMDLWRSLHLVCISRSKTLLGRSGKSI